MENSSFEIIDAGLAKTGSPFMNINRFRNVRSGDNDPYIQLHRQVKQYGTYNRYGARIPVPSKMNLTLFENLLTDYHDRDIIEWLRFGWPTGVPLEVNEFDSQLINHKGATEFPDHIDQYFLKEIKAGATTQPHVGIPFETRFAINPLNSRSKKNSDSKRRIILDLSFPKGSSVNDQIPKESYLGKKYKLTYPTVDTLAKRIHDLDYKAFIYRVDEERSFRQNPLDPIDYGLIGMHWKGLFFFDVNSPQGLRTGAMFCQRCTNAVRHIMNQLGYFLLNYLDDLHGCETIDKIESSFITLLKLMRDLRRDVAHDKTTKPTQVIEVLGIWFDVLQRVMAITPERLSEIMEILQFWRTKKYASKKEMQRLLGKLQFIAKCIRPGRIFISRLLRWMHHMSECEYKVLDDDMRKDIRWWYLTIPDFTGVSIMWYLEAEQPDIFAASDSSLTACGAHTDRKFFHSVFPEFILNQTQHIAQRELLTIAVTIKIFAAELSGRKITFLCDNQASVYCVNTGRTKDRFMQQVLREIAYLSTMGNFLIRTRFIDTKSNRPADILSRWDSIPDALNQFYRAIGHTNFTEVKICDNHFKFINDW